MWPAMRGMLRAVVRAAVRDGVEGCSNVAMRVSVSLYIMFVCVHKFISRLCSMSENESENGMNRQVSKQNKMVPRGDNSL